MSVRLTHDDEAMLLSVADYGVLTTSQLATLHGRNVNALRRRLRYLGESEFLDLSTQRLGDQRGRPENVIMLGPEGAAYLRSRQPGGSQFGFDASAKIDCLDHELLVADFRIQLVQMQWLIPELEVRFLGPRRPASSGPTEAQVEIRERLRLGEDEEVIEFVPDGVVTVRHQELGKTLLFFVEVDRSTQPLASSSPLRGNILRKITNYQTLFQSGQYRRYEKIVHAELRGFRLLVVTNNRARLAKLCRSVRQMQPSDFIWLTDRETMLSQGVWAPVWARGGKDGGVPESILGTKMPNPPPTAEAMNGASLPRRFIRGVACLLGGRPGS